VYEFNGCYWHGHTCQSFRGVTTVAGDPLAERYEKCVTQAGYRVEVQWESEFDEGILVAHPVLKSHPLYSTSR
jgi:G:T-mismatch repair DNA endonuclease (very short patch repair protein)